MVDAMKDQASHVDVEGRGRNIERRPHVESDDHSAGPSRPRH